MILGVWLYEKYIMLFYIYLKVIVSCMSRFIAYNLDNGNIQDRKPIYSIPIRLLQIYCLIKRIWTINFQLYNIRHPEFVFVRLKSFKWQDNKILCISIEYSRRVLYILFLFFLFRKRCYFILYVRICLFCFTW